VKWYAHVRNTTEAGNSETMATGRKLIYWKTTEVLLEVQIRVSRLKTEKYIYFLLK
jgi:hypothetical protein